MPRSLNTSHPLFGNLVYLIGVEDDGVTLKDFVTPSRVITPNTTAPNAASFGTGTYGAHFSTGGAVYDPRGATISPAIPGQTGAYSMFVVHNGVTRYDAEGNATSRNSYWLGNGSVAVDGRPNGMGIFGVVSAGGVVGVHTGDPGGGLNYVAAGTTTYQGATARSLCGTRDNASTRRLRIYVDGAQEGPTNTSGGPNGGSADTLTKIGGGGDSTGSLGANLVWLVGFNKELTAAEVASLHSSLGAGNVFGLITVSSDTTPPTLSSPSGTGGLGVCSGSVSTNEAAGDLYAVATASATAPTALQVRNGQDHTGAAALRARTQAVTSTGAQSIPSGAITGGAGTRFWHFMHEDAAGNRSAVVSSAGFSVTAAATQLVVTVPDAAGLSGFNAVVLSAAAPGAGVTVIATPTGITFNGSGQATINVAGLGVPIGDRRWVSTTNSTGDPAQSPAPVQAQGPVTAS